MMFRLLLSNHRLMLTLSILLSAYFITTHIGREKVRSAAADEFGQVVVVNKNLAVGHSLEATDLELEKWPSSLMPSGCFAEVDMVVGRVLMRNISGGEILLLDKFEVPGPAATPVNLSRTAPRIIIVPVNLAGGVGGLILPGAYPARQD